MGSPQTKKLEKLLIKLVLRKILNHIFRIERVSDNAAMIAIAGLKNLKNKFDRLDFSIKPRWSLDSKAKFLKGSGVKL